MKTLALCALFFSCASRTSQPTLEAPSSAPTLAKAPTTAPAAAPASVVASAPVSQSSSSATTPPPTPGCAALHQHWRQEMFGDELTPQDEVELQRYVQHFPCSLRLDLDGDKLPDEVSLIERKTKVGLSIAWGNGKSKVLGAGTKIKLAPDDEDISDFNWLFGWSVAVNEKGSFLTKVLGQVRSFGASDALGDGLLLDGGDASAILYLSKKGWRLLELGF